MQSDSSRTPARLLTTKEAARVLAVCPRTVAALTAAGQLNVVRIGRAVRYAAEDLQRYIDTRRGQGVAHAK